MKIAVRAMNSKIKHKNNQKNQTQKKSEKIEHKKNQKNQTTKIKEWEKEIILTLAFSIQDLMIVRTKKSEEGRENRHIRTQEAKKAKEELLKKHRTLGSTNF